VVPVLMLGWLAVAWRGAPAGTVWVLAAAAALAALSFIDDLRGLPVRLRLVAHAAAVLFGLAALPSTVFQGVLPPMLDRATTFLAWLWFVELFNFMDGIDGIAGVETAILGFGLALVLAVAGGADDGAAALALAAGAAGLGFLVWNWHPARIFLGDVGSVPLGFLIGWLLLLAAAKGYWAPALILPLYYIADASITLARRVARRAAFWQAHREHFYQRALARDGNHAAVAQLVLWGDAVLVLLALAALAQPLAALAATVVAVAVMLALLQRRSHG
jgi:UDP-N-acetylmuramyl pentapeptide phosphotransferase/UDP-N-acetylglucosamine-1-phosphate transferase